MTGRTMPDDVKAKISAANRGRKHTPEAIEKMRQAKREWWARQPAARRAAIAAKISASKRK